MGMTYAVNVNACPVTVLPYDPLTLKVPLCTQSREVRISALHQPPGLALIIRRQTSGSMTRGGRLLCKLLFLLLLAFCPGTTRPLHLTLHHTDLPAHVLQCHALTKQAFQSACGLKAECRMMLSWGQTSNETCKALRASLKFIEIIKS